MSRRAIIEVDEELLERAREVLGETATQGVVEDALRRAAEGQGTGSDVRFRAAGPTSPCHERARRATPRARRATPRARRAASRARRATPHARRATPRARRATPRARRATPRARRATSRATRATPRAKHAAVQRRVRCVAVRARGGTTGSACRCHANPLCCNRECVACRADALRCNTKCVSLPGGRAALQHEVRFVAGRTRCVATRMRCVAAPGV
jgi:hypothetical protein